MFAKIDVVSTPVEEPVTLEELKRKAGIEDNNTNIYRTDEDFQRILIAARQRCEKYTRRSLITQTLDVWYDAGDGLGYIELPRAPIQSVLSVTTYDPYGEVSVADPTIYDLVGADVIFSDWLPYFRDRLGLVVRVVAGYGPYPEDVPGPLREGILEYAAFQCDNPGGEGPNIRYEVQAGQGGIPAGVIDKWRSYQLAVMP